ncbi:MAG TPA: hypothetical protein VGM44_11965 [Polyangiaceae bacterium]|jgi:hypothetical protein
MPDLRPHGFALICLLLSVACGQSWPAMQAAGGSDDWKGLMTMAHAIIDPAAGYSALSALNGIESGNSRSNMLFWAATRKAP